VPTNTVQPIPSRSDYLDYARAHAPEALEYAFAHGIVRYKSDGSVGHLPFSLLPYQADPSFVQVGVEATLLFNQLYHQVAGNLDYLEQHLSVARSVDPFVAGLFGALAEKPVPKPTIYISRNDFMPSRQASATGAIVPKQVEMNLMAASLGFMSERVERLQSYLYHETPLGERIIRNPGGTVLARQLADAFTRYKTADSIILFIVPPGEVNAFDQRALQALVRQEYGIPVLRTHLAELGSEGEVKRGFLHFRGRPVTLAYFRAGYNPAHYTDENCWKARKMIEQSETISIPSIPTQLANTKKIQQILSQRKELERFAPSGDVEVLLRTQVVMSAVDAPLEFEGKSGSARDLALENPERWVLKPFREGGGNNHFGEDLVQLLKTLTPEQAQAYILMEVIEQESFLGISLMENTIVESPCVTEMGHFAGCIYEPGARGPLKNETFGYLLRTKDHRNNEGLVLGGYSYLDVACMG
jgi:glutathione synthetase